MGAGTNTLVYVLRRDLRTRDNPILHHLATASDHGFTHLLPVFVFVSRQMEVSGFLRPDHQSPYPPARSQVGGYWRCGPHRAKFITQAVWDLRNNLQRLDSGLVIRVGEIKDVVDHLIRDLDGESSKPAAVWMTDDVSWEEKQEQDQVAAVCTDHGVGFKVWPDEKYFVDDRDTELSSPKDLPDVFTTYRKSQELLRQRPRPVLPAPKASALPPFPTPSTIPKQHGPFDIPDSCQQFEANLLKPLDDILAEPPKFPDDAESGHPFKGGENAAQDRLTHLVKSGAVTSYKATRNGLLGSDYSTKLSAFLALGCITARQVHEALVKFEDGEDATYEGVQGYGGGENEGTKAIRFELLWRDYMRLCTAKFGRKLFSLSGFTQGKRYDGKWKSANTKMAPKGQTPPPTDVAKMLHRFLSGNTGMGLIDASQRELFLTGYTSNRARQNAASFLTKHLGIDWRYGAEWYEMMLVDHDVSSNWANWQYVAGVGNDPRGDARIFNPVKQAFDYDKDGTFVRTWLPELKDLEKSENVFQVWTTSPEDLEKTGLTDNIMVTDPLKRIDFRLDRKPRNSRRSFPRKRGGGQGGRGGGGGDGGRRRGTGGSPRGGASNQGMNRDQNRPNEGPANGQATPDTWDHYKSGKNYTTAQNMSPQYNTASSQTYVPSYPANWYPDQFIRSRGSGQYGYSRAGNGRWQNYRPSFPDGYLHQPPPFGPVYPFMQPGHHQ
ncbi:hypothetical protein L249_3923 [Ophiocordyceps polyrhachis-furcata BCC 54312]|uniref:Cryptochrome DASH n=1 Tax=Ophiocordyceps polyrhachis-furcata BCC 54312 TaxID=1330021 RepID=A0A367L556_9HYPO|nr:hypothetical protein L249_3923 [Ophiocordyceps polyrhachis-furcata BCC 54312]